MTTQTTGAVLVAGGGIAGIQACLDLANSGYKVYLVEHDAAIGTYGERETLYEKAREKGVIFIRFDQDHKPKVAAADDGLAIEVVDHVLQHPIVLKADLLILASAVVLYSDEQLAQFFKVPLNADGFFVEAHVKLNPCAFATDGVFLCGLAHYPKPIDESIAQAQAAASAAACCCRARPSKPAAIRPWWMRACVPRAACV